MDNNYSTWSTESSPANSDSIATTIPLDLQSPSGSRPPDPQWFFIGLGIFGAVIVVLLSVLLRSLVTRRRNRLSVDLRKPIAKNPDDYYVQYADSASILSTPTLSSKPQLTEGGYFKKNKNKKKKEDNEAGIDISLYDNSELECAFRNASTCGAQENLIHIVSIEPMTQTVLAKCGRSEEPATPVDQLFCYLSKHSCEDLVNDASNNSFENRSPSSYLSLQEKRDVGGEMKTNTKSMAVGGFSSKSRNQNVISGIFEGEGGMKYTAASGTEYYQDGHKNFGSVGTDASERHSISSADCFANLNTVNVGMESRRNDEKRKKQADRCYKPHYATVSAASSRLRHIGGLEVLQNVDAINRPVSAITSTDGNLDKYGSLSRHPVLSRDPGGTIPLTGGNFPLTPNVQQSYNRTQQTLQPQFQTLMQQQLSLQHANQTVAVESHLISQEQQQQLLQNQQKNNPSMQHDMQSRSTANLSTSQQQEQLKLKFPSSQQLHLEQAQLLVLQSQKGDRNSNLQNGISFQTQDDQRDSINSARPYPRLSSVCNDDVNPYSCDSDITDGSATSRYARIRRDSPNDVTDDSMRMRYADVDVPKVKLFKGGDGSSSAGVYSSIGGSGDAMARAKDFNYASPYDDENWNAENREGCPLLGTLDETNRSSDGLTDGLAEETGTRLYEEVAIMKTSIKESSEGPRQKEGDAVSTRTPRRYEEVQIISSLDCAKINQSGDEGNKIENKPEMVIPPKLPATRPTPSADQSKNTLERNRNVSIKNKSSNIAAEFKTSSKDPISVKSNLKDFQHHYPHCNMLNKSKTLGGSQRYPNQQAVASKKKRSILNMFKRMSHSYDGREYEAAHTVDINSFSQMKELQKSSDAVSTETDTYEHAHKVNVQNLNQRLELRTPSDESLSTRGIYEGIKSDDEEPVYEESIAVNRDFLDDIHQYSMEKLPGSTQNLETVIARLKPTGINLIEASKSKERSDTEFESGIGEDFPVTLTDLPGFDEILFKFGGSKKCKTESEMESKSREEIQWNEDDPIIVDNDCYGMLVDCEDESIET